MRYCPLCKANLEIVTIENNAKLKCSKCYFTFWNNPSPVTASILLYNNDIVLVRPNYVKNDTWMLPGGYVDEAETAEDALIREIKEETNTDAKINKFLGTYPIIRTNKNLLYIVFEAQVLSGIPKASAEIADVITVDRESILNQKFGTTTSNVIHDWINSKTFESAVSK